MKVINIFIVLILMGLAVSCSTTYGVLYDYDTNVNFASLKTYDWLPITENANIDSLIIERVKSAVNAELQAKGLMMTSNDPDFLITERLGKIDTVQVTNYGYSYAPHSMYRSPGKTATYEYEEGSLILDFVDAKSKKMIWRGVAKAEVQNVNTPEKREKRINEAVQKILNNFPPKPNK